MPPLLSLAEMCGSQGSDIGVTPVYKNEKRRESVTVEEGNATADVERQRMVVVVMERAMQRSPRGILIRFLAAHPPWVKWAVFTHIPVLVLNALQYRGLLPARFLPLSIMAHIHHVTVSLLYNSRSLHLIILPTDLLQFLHFS